MTNMEQNNSEEMLVGARPEDQEKKIEPRLENGQSIWLAMINEEVINIDSTQAEVARNALAELAEKHPEVISMCDRKPIEECRDILKQYKEAA